MAHALPVRTRPFSRVGALQGNIDGRNCLKTRVITVRLGELEMPHGLAGLARRSDRIASSASLTARLRDMAQAFYYSVLAAVCHSCLGETQVPFTYCRRALLALVGIPSSF
jgi:hypothetical protein